MRRNMMPSYCYTTSDNGQIIGNNGKPFRNYKIYGSTYHSYPDVFGVGDDISTYEEGRNYKFTIMPKTKNLFFFTKDDFRNGWLADRNRIKGVTIFPNENKYYTLSSNVPQETPIYLLDDPVYEGHPATNSGVSELGMDFYFKVNQMESILAGDYWFQLEEGTVATEYEPPGKPTHIYLDSPLFDGDYIEYATQKKNDTEDIYLPPIQFDPGDNEMIVISYIPPTKIELEYYKDI